MILHSGAPAVAKIMQNVDLLKKDFVRLEGKLPQLDEISERLENLSDLTLNEVRATSLCGMIIHDVNLLFIMPPG